MSPDAPFDLIAISLELRRATQGRLCSTEPLLSEGGIRGTTPCRAGRPPVREFAAMLPGSGCLGPAHPLRTLQLPLHCWVTFRLKDCCGIFFWCLLHRRESKGKEKQSFVRGILVG
jgi:hypothetical protein